MQQGGAQAVGLMGMRDRVPGKVRVRVRGRGRLRLRHRHRHRLRLRLRVRHRLRLRLRLRVRGVRDRVPQPAGVAHRLGPRAEAQPDHLIRVGLRVRDSLTLDGDRASAEA